MRPLAEMDLDELYMALTAAVEAERAAEFQDVHSAYVAARDAAVARGFAVRAEIDRRTAANNEAGKATDV